MCSKRSLNDTDDTKKPKQFKHWSMGLLDAMKDPDCIIKKNENIIVIRDKYPKAKVHYLMIPEENISSIYKLNKNHLDLMEEFASTLKDLIEEHKNIELKAGFHAVPSMQRMHMHIISKDMISNCLKTKIHWNSFTTDFFLPFQDVFKELKGKGSIGKISSEKHKSLMATPLQCNQCNFKPKNMPQLKDHLISHENK